MKLPKHIWADYDPTAPRGTKWAFYNTRSEQRANRPDLRPIRLAVSPATSRPSRSSRLGVKKSDPVVSWSQ